MLYPNSDDLKLYKSNRLSADIKVVPNITVPLRNNRKEKIEKVLTKITDFSLTISTDSDIRRTANISMALTKDEFDSISQLDWLDVSLDIFLELSNGIYKNSWQQGHFYVIENSYQYDDSQSLATLNLADPTVLYNGDRSGTIDATAVEILEKNKVTLTKVIMDTLSGVKCNNVDIIGSEYAEVDKYDESGKSIGKMLDSSVTLLPYDLTIDSELTKWSVVKQLVDIIPGWEAFFDEMGKFNLQKIPCSDRDHEVMEISDDLLVSESGNRDLTEFYNATTIYCSDFVGDAIAVKTTIVDERNSNTNFLNEKIYLNLDCSADDVDLDNFTVTFTMPDSYESEGKTVEFNQADNPVFFLRFKINDADMYGVPYKAIVSDNNICRGRLQKKKNYAIRYVNDDSAKARWGNADFLGETSPIVGEFLNDNPKFEYNTNDYGVRKQVLSGGEYENIYDKKSAYDRAQEETWEKTRIANSITLTTILLPWLSVNQKIKFRGEYYLIDSISRDYANFTDTIQMSIFYPMYQYSNIRAGQIRTVLAKWEDYMTTKWGTLSSYSWKDLQERII